MSNVHRQAQWIAERWHELSDGDTDRLASTAQHAAERAAALANAVQPEQSSRGNDLFVALQQVQKALASAQSASSALMDDDFGVLSDHGTRQLERARLELSRVLGILETIRFPSEPHNYVKDLVLDNTRTLYGQLHTRLAVSRPLQGALNSLQEDLLQARTEIHSRAGTFAADQALATAMGTALTKDLASEYLLGLSADVATGADLLTTAVTDMTAADLTGVDLSGLRLTGVTWSAETRWPTAWQDSIRARSTEIGPNLYRIVDSPGIDTTPRASVFV